MFASRRHRRNAIIALSLSGALTAGGFTLGATQQLSPFAGDASACTVTEKTRSDPANSETIDMRVHTTCGVFAVAVSPLLGHWASAERFTELTVGETYDFEATGWRLPWDLSLPNIIDLAQTR